MNTTQPPAPRGACPTLDNPMAVADGLLARFRPQNGLTASQVEALAHAAETHGNGLVEITARGNLQVRGLREDTARPFRADLAAAGITPQPLPAVEISPIAGLDPKARIDPRPLAEKLRAVIATALDNAPLSPKLSIVMVTGGQVLLDGLKADIRLIALSEGWALELAGETLGALATEAVPPALAAVLDMLQAVGPRARSEDLDTHEVRDALNGLTPSPPSNVRPAAYMLGPLSLDTGPGLRVGLPFGQVRAWHLHELARLMGEHDITEARTAPDRTLVLLGFSAAALRALAPALSGIGFWTRPDVTGALLSICSGAESSDLGIIQSAELAQASYAVDPELIDGSFHIHVSTCAKGCPHAGRPGIMLVGNGLTLYRGAARNPFATLDPGAIESSIVSLAARIRDTRQPGETTLSVLGRLEPQ